MQPMQSQFPEAPLLSHGYSNMSLQSGLSSRSFGFCICKMGTILPSLQPHFVVTRIKGDDICKKDL